MALFIEKGFLYFIFFSFVGWSWESFQYTIENKKFINRGFLKGPYCPIYGWGGLIIIAFLHNIDNVFALFFCGSLLCTALEYMTSLILEKIFNKRWWDYSSYRFNLHGRICLICSTTFGVLSVLLVKLVQPFMDRMIVYFPENGIHCIFMITFTAYIVDNLYTFYHMSNSIRTAFPFDKFKKLSAVPQLSNSAKLKISEKFVGGNNNE